MKFIADAMLGTLAKWLRILGYDTLYDPAMNDHHLVRIARAGDRVLLTRDRELARRPGISVLLMESEHLDDQVRQVLSDPHVKAVRPRPGSRCPICNEPLQPLDRETAQARVPSYVARTHRSFRHCPACQRVYWRGSHWQRMERRLAQFRQGESPAGPEGASETNLA